MAGKEILINDLRPTQLTLGLEDVNRRAKKMRLLEPNELARLIEKNLYLMLSGHRAEFTSLIIIISVVRYGVLVKRKLYWVKNWQIGLI